MERTTQIWWDDQAIFNQLRLRLIRQPQAQSLREYLLDDLFTEEFLYVLQTAASIPSSRNAVERVKEWLLQEALRDDVRYRSPYAQAEHHSTMKLMWELLGPLLCEAVSPRSAARNPSRRSLSSLPSHSHASMTPMSGAYANAQHASRPSLSSMTPAPLPHAPRQSSNYSRAQHSRPSLSSMTPAPLSRPSLSSMTPAPLSRPQEPQPNYSRAQHSRSSLSSMTPVPLSRSQEQLSSYSSAQHPRSPMASTENARPPLPSAENFRPPLPSAENPRPPAASVQELSHSQERLARYSSSQYSRPSLSSMTPGVHSQSEVPGHPGSPHSRPSLSSMTSAPQSRPPMPSMTPPPRSRASMPSMTPPPRSGASMSSMTPPSRSRASMPSLTPAPRSGPPDIPSTPQPSYHSIADLEHLQGQGFPGEAPHGMWPVPDSFDRSSPSFSGPSLPRTPLSSACIEAYNPPDSESGEFDAVASMEPTDSAGWQSHMPSPDMRPPGGWWKSQSILNSLKLRLTRHPELRALRLLLGQWHFTDRLLEVLEKAAERHDCEEAQLDVYDWLLTEEVRNPGLDARSLWMLLNPILQSYADALMGVSAEETNEPPEARPRPPSKEDVSKTQEEFRRLLDYACERLAGSPGRKKKSPH